MKESSEGIPEELQVKFLDEGTLSVVKASTSAVSTANSELLIATCAVCYDLRREKPQGDNPFSEGRFLFVNRLVIVVIASASLVLSQLSLPGILAIGRISWTLLAVCFLFPLYFPLNQDGIRPRLFRIICLSLAMHIAVILLTPVTAEVSMLIQLALQGAVYLHYGRMRG